MSKLNLEDTIAALSTPPGEGGIAVIRVSGKEALSLTSRCFRPSKKENLAEQPSHTIHHGHLLDDRGNVMDEVLVSIFRAPHSYTGEDVVEISCHGGVRLTQRILEILFRQGARPAEPGEFTRRAFLNGKLDLTQVEAVLDLIRARSEASLATAVRQLQGNLSRKINHLKETLLKIYSHLEAGLDFPDERLEVDSREEGLKRMEEVAEEIRLLVASFRRGARLREGVLTVIVGRPNVGKSSLLNALLEKDRALVSAIPGTTRDALEEEIEIGGIGLQIVDTAGLGTNPKHPLDQMAMERTHRYLQEGDLFLFLADGSSEWALEDEKILEKIENKNCLMVVNKIDLPQQLKAESFNRFNHGEPCFISCVTGEGFTSLEKRIEEKIISLGAHQESPTLTRLRHKNALEGSLEALRQAQEAMKKEISPELILIDLKSAIDALRELIGEVYSEDLLDVLFQEFCIGK